MNMTSRWLALFASAGACMALVMTSNACGDDDTTSTSSSTENTSTSTGVGGSAGAGGGNQGGAGGGGGMTTTVNCSPPEGMAGGLTLTEVTSVPGTPLLVTSVPGDSERLYILEQEGRIRLFQNGQLSVFLDISSKVLSMNERGLLGMAFHPDYIQNGRFFVHYSNSSGATVIAEYARDANDPNVAAADPVVEPLLQITQPFANHNGGSIEFNPMDGFLYIGMGDGGSANDPLDSGQDLTSLLGAMLRLDVSDTSGNPPYAIPAGNMQGGAPEIYDSGLRNPYRFSFDPCTGDRYIGDVGQDCYEEISVASVADGGQNFGWKVMEGQHCRGMGNNCNLLPPNDCDDTGMTPAAVEYLHEQGASPLCDSVTGGVVYRGSAIPWLRGAYLYSDFCDGRTWMFRWSNGTVSDQQEITQQLGSSGVNISGFGLDNDGEVYLTAAGGSVYRIDPN